MAIKVLARAIIFILRNVQWERNVTLSEINHHDRALRELAGR
jgi:hypothetical protein